MTPRRVFDAFATESGKAAWFVAQSDKWTLLEREFDFRPGGRERLKSRWQSGLVSLFDAIYFDIVPGERIVYAYDLWHEGRKLSVSLATLEFHAVDGGTTVKLCEQGAFLDDPNIGAGGLGEGPHGGDPVGSGRRRPSLRMEDRS